MSKSPAEWNEQRLGIVEIKRLIEGALDELDKVDDVRMAMGAVLCLDKIEKRLQKSLRDVNTAIGYLTITWD